jgi:hypothetical protein
VHEKDSFSLYSGLDAVELLSQRIRLGACAREVLCMNHPPMDLKTAPDKAISLRR